MSHSSSAEHGPLEALVQAYARALLSLSKGSSSLERDIEGLHLIELCLRNERVRCFIDYPGVPTSEKALVLKGWLAKTKIGRVPRNFTLTLVRRRQLYLLGPVLELLERLKGTKPQAFLVRVTTALPLPSTVERALAITIRKSCGALALLEYFVDPALLGGMTVQLYDKLIDLSLSSRLQALLRLAFSCQLDYKRLAAKPPSIAARRS